MSSGLCSSCGTQNPEGHKFCSHCGVELGPPRQPCSSCGSDNPEGRNFCGHCGAQLGVAGKAPSKSHTEPAGVATLATAPQTKTNQASSLAQKSGAPRLAWLLPLIFVVVVGAGLGLFFGLTGIGSGNPFTSTLPPSLEFDDTAPLEMGTEDPPAPPVVDSITPLQGGVGTRVQISGSGLASDALQSVTLGEDELNFYSASDDLIEVHVPHGAESGDITLVFANREVNTGRFEVVEQERQLLLETELTPSNKEQTVSVGDISVTIPAGALDAPETLTVEAIAEPQPVNLPESAEGTAFSVSLGDMHQFSDAITIAYTLPPEETGEPSAAYFDELISQWSTLPSEVVDGRLLIQTDHLTDFFVFYWGSSIYSPNGSFKIYYHKNDRVTYKSSMDEFAQAVGVALEQIRQDYDAKIPARYRFSFTFMSLPDSMDVYLDSGYKCGKYNPATNNILLPTSYKRAGVENAEEFEVTLAHELFHAYQDAALNELYGRMSNRGSLNKNHWALEAIAELAAWDLAFPEKNRRRPLDEIASCTTPYDCLDGSQEYNMACYLDYLLDECGASFPDLWTHVAGSGKLLINTAMSDFFRSKSSKFGSFEQSYATFWKDVVGDSDAPSHRELSNLFEGAEYKVGLNRHRVNLSYRGLSPTLEMNMVRMNEFSDDASVRIFVAEVPDESKNDAWLAPVSGVWDALGVEKARVSGGHSWAYLSSAEGADWPKYEIYQFKESSRDVLLVALDRLTEKGSSVVTLTEVQAQANPGRLDGASVGEEYEFEFGFKGIPQCVTDLKTVVDWGDDSTEDHLARNSKEGQLGATLKHTFASLVNTVVKCSLYDASGSTPRLIAQVSVPIAITQEATTTTVEDTTTTDTSATAPLFALPTEPVGIGELLVGSWSGTLTDAQGVRPLELYITGTIPSSSELATYEERGGAEFGGAIECWYEPRESLYDNADFTWWPGSAEEICICRWEMDMGGRNIALTPGDEACTSEGFFGTGITVRADGAIIMTGEYYSSWSILPGSAQGLEDLRRENRNGTWTVAKEPETD